MNIDEIQREIDASEVCLPVETLRTRDDNPRLNTDAAKALAQAIQQIGWGAPVLVQSETNLVIGGHTRLKAAAILGLERVPVRVLDVDDKRAKALALADNRLGELAAWDTQALAQELESFSLDEAEFLGFDTKFLEDLANDVGGFGPLAADETSSLDQRDLLDHPFAVVIYCEDEQDQLSVLEACGTKGWKCRALT